MREINPSLIFYHICPKCGQLLPSDAEFCGFCGNALVDKRVETAFQVEKPLEKSTALEQVPPQRGLSVIADNKTQNTGDRAAYDEPGDQTADNQSYGGRHERIMRCPRCKKHHLQMVVETATTTTTSGGGYSGAKGCLGFMLLGPFGLLCGNCGGGPTTSTQTTTEKYWVCQDCGERTRDPEELKKAIAEAEASLPLTIGLGWFFTCAAVIMLLGWMSSPRGNGLIGFIGLCSICIGVPVLILGYAGKEAIPERKAEYERLMRDFYDP